nr:MAG TPA: hypothetical protein [Caudoviricetes sp.]
MTVSYICKNLVYKMIIASGMILFTIKNLLI